MQRRYTAEERGGATFTGRDGQRLRIASITFELDDDPVESPPPTGELKGVSSTFEEQPQLEGIKHPISPQKPKTERTPSDDIDELLRHYAEVMETRGGAESLLKDEQARKIIRDALKVATVAECKRAIDGCKASPFHMGDNDRRKKYNRVGQILKGRPTRGETTRERINFFIDLAEKAGVESGFTSVAPAVLSQHKRAILDAWEFPNDEGATRRGEESEAWLKEHGWVVDRSQGRPQFKRGGPDGQAR